MSIETIIVFALLVVAMVLFMSDRVSFDVTALIILSTLMLTGIVSPQEGISGFSNAATVTIGAMFVLSEGLRRTGVLRHLSDLFADVGGGSFSLTVGFMMVVIGVVSAFINNTAAVAIFIPVVIGLSNQLGVSASKLLMPLSFASMFGGVCTLIGTSTNILVSSIAESHGAEPFGMFEFTALGLIFAAVGGAYTFFVGIPMIPSRRMGKDLTSDYEMQEYLTDVVLSEESPHVGETVEESALTKDLDLDILQVFRSSREPVQRDREAPLEAGNVLRVRGGVQEIEKMLEREDITLRPARDWYDVDLEGGPDKLVEAVAAPDSALESESIGDVDFPDRFGAVPLAIRRHGTLQQEHLEEVRLSGGDSVLLNIDEERASEIERDPSFVLATEVEVEQYREKRTPIALTILATVVLLAAFDITPIVVSAIAGCVAMVLTGCITTEEAYQAINWKIIFLLAGVIPLGTAMENTGAAGILSATLIDTLGPIGPTAVLSGFFFLSMMLTNIISNQATAALLAPIALQAAESLGVDSRPLLMAITYAASLSFMTPVGYQTNTMIYGPGQYKFTDFTKVGTPLNILLWILATFLIPWIWPF
ncbi:SLC13 family permease [Longibacter salinarum]|uniref:SLC13 family permease n=1 Tax=Longibacter salinarum TaxID=1850348 RepID=A0A2A8CWG1_9BACT|nr:SLC13 family permease [Longibacter salinarum]PEN13035.1 SLC13 family permease [Longibacter salinarum]